MAQTEPEFVGDVIMILPDSTTILLDKEFAQFRVGASLKANSWDASFLTIDRSEASVRVSKGAKVQLVVRAVSNDSDPMTIISIYKFDVKRKRRETMLAVNNTDNPFQSSRTITKNMLPFRGKKYGISSYIIELNNLQSGEYGVVTRNPIALDEKISIVSCFAVE